MRRMESPAPPPVSASANSLVEGYAPESGGWDEMILEPGAMRGHWEHYMKSFARLGQPEVARRWDQASRLLKHGSSIYQVFVNQPTGHTRWELGPVPHLISPDDWAQIEAAVTQRARLMNAILGDLYGQQLLVREALIPPELVYSNPGFLRPCHGLRPPGDTYLHIYGADIARAPDGRWSFLSDHTQAPAGMGFAMENRTILSRTFPEIFDSTRVRRLVAFFQALRATLRQLAPFNRDNPLIVLLSPGPTVETFFEHTYLARHLGYPLVEGADLTVRDNCVYLKTLAGLRRVDVILRRVDDRMCDPLELRYDSNVGVPGLVQAIRAGNVAVVNSLGSGIASSPGLVPFLPALCRQLLDEELRLPSVNTWWCGEPAPLKHVLQNLDKLVVRRAYAKIREDIYCGWKMSGEEREKLAAEILERSNEYVGQDRIDFSTTPSWERGRLTPRHMVLRVYAVATENGYTVMPGGLTRVADSVDELAIGSARIARSKDCWVLSKGKVEKTGLAQQAMPLIALSRKTFDQPSRVADNMFWMGRYVERAECGVRMMRMVLSRLTAERGRELIPELPTLLRGLEGMYLIDTASIDVDAERADPELDKMLLGVLFDQDNRASLCSAMRALQRTSLMVYDRISVDMWKILHRLNEEFPETAPGGNVTMLDAYELTDRLVLTLSAFSGLAMESMTRGHSWRFLDIGRRLERALFLIELLRSTVPRLRDQETAALQSLLEVADSSMTYRSRYLSLLQVAPFIDLLVMDESNPRSVAFQLSLLSDHLAALPAEITPSPRAPTRSAIDSMLTALRIADADMLCEMGADGVRSRLEAMLTDMADRLPNFSEKLAEGYFSHTDLVRNIGEPPPEPAN